MPTMTQPSSRPCQTPMARHQPAILFSAGRASSMRWPRAPGMSSARERIGDPDGLRPGPGQPGADLVGELGQGVVDLGLLGSGRPGGDARAARPTARPSLILRTGSRLDEPLEQPAHGPADEVDGPQLAGALQRVADGGHPGRLGERGGELGPARRPGCAAAVRLSTARRLPPHRAGPGVGRLRGRGRSGVPSSSLRVLPGVGQEPGGDGVHVGGDAGGGGAAGRDGLGRAAGAAR